MLKRLIPLADHVAGYNQNMLKSDLVAGLTVGIMLIPQGMAYALIAGMPPIYGLYASLIPLVIYGLFGTSRQLSVAPVAMMSLLAAAGVGPIAGGDVERYIALALLLAMMVGFIQFALGLARFGFLTNFLSHPILAGFTSAAALIIGFSQIKHLLGISIERSHHIHDILWQAVQQWEDVHIPTIIIGLAGIVLLVGLKRWKKSFPGALLLVVLAILAVWGLSLSDSGVLIVGEVPGGLPGFALPIINWTDLTLLFPTALAISLVGFMESIAVAKVYASKNQYEVDANQELIGLGLANIIGSLFQSFPVAGGFSRTAVNAEAGAKTQVSAMVSAGIIALTLLFLTPLFYFLPNAVLASIILVAIVGLIDWKEAVYLWRVDRMDFGLMLLTFFATLGLGIEQGILVGVVASLLLVLHQSSRPHSAFEGRLPGTNTFRNLERNPKAQAIPGVGIFRLDASLYFANAGYFKDQIARLDRQHGGLHALIFNFFPVNRLDSSAVHALHEVIEEYRQRGVHILFAGVKGPVMDRMEKAGLVKAIGIEHFFLELHEAVDSLSPDEDPEPQTVFYSTLMASE